jgi:hypothetical protein
MHRNDWYSRKYNKTGTPSGDKWFGAYAGATVLSVVWPAILIIWLQGRSEKFLVGEERQAVLEQKDRRIKELERQLEL